MCNFSLYGAPPPTWGDLCIMAFVKCSFTESGVRVDLNKKFQFSALFMFPIPFV